MTNALEFQLGFVDGSRHHAGDAGPPTMRATPDVQIVLVENWFELLKERVPN